ncbi:hypothetical protein ACJJTC_013342 [Scirpophaga incertulas]
MCTKARYEIMNRIKNAELYEEFQENLRREKARKIQKHKEDILKLWRERDEREARELAERRRFYGPEAEAKLREEERRLLEHARLLLREARQAARPAHALRRALDRYCKMYRLYPMPELPCSMQEHFGDYHPIDRSKLDKPEEPIGSEKLVRSAAPDGPDAQKQHDSSQLSNDENKRDGLQNATKTEEGSLKVSQKPDNQSQNTAFNRTDKANGLQREIRKDDTQDAVTALPSKEDQK